MEQIKTGLTFSDVLLIPKRTKLNSRSEADLKTNFTKNIILNCPLVSSNMISVTEHKMAIALAREGGIGVIHQFNKIEEQVIEVKKVKRSTSYIIEKPITSNQNISIQEAKEIMKKEGVTSLLIIENDELIGILARRDYLFETNLERKVSEIMTPKEKLITTNHSVTLEEAKEILHINKIEKLPLIKDNKLFGLITTQDIKKIENWPNSARDKKGRLLVAAAVGVKDTIERAEKLIEAGADVIVLDIAHAHSNLAILKLKEFKSKFKTDILVGNIATKEAAMDLIEAGADGLKVGIGPSPVCTTRIISGSGVPQLTAIIDVYAVAKKYNIPVSADGGMKYPGDAAKALAAGASTVYSGSFFSGTDEAPGYVIMKEGKRYKRYFGSASYTSSHERNERINDAKLKEKIDVFVEGVANLVDYKGPVDDVIKSLLKGIRSGISYCGAQNLEEMKKNAEFIRITSNGWNESLSRGKRLSE